MVCLVEGDEGFGVFGCGINFSGILDSDNIINGSMHDEEVAAEFCDSFFLVVFGEVVEKAFSDLELAACKAHFGLAVSLNLGEVVGEEVSDMTRIVRGSESDDVRDFGDFSSSSEDGGAAEGVSDKEGGGLKVGS